ncbi:MAG: cell division protein SepF [Ilumatobacteraceae bacterium]
MSIFKRTLDYLGLGPDDAYDYDDDYDYEGQQPIRGNEPDVRSQRGPRDDFGNEGVVRTLPSRPTFPSRDFDPSQARRDRDDSETHVRPQRATRVVPVPSGEPVTVRPRRFDQAQEVADRFKEGQPVIMNLEGSDREVARRLIDFASGLCYGLDGSMEKVANGVYLLKPTAPTTRQDGYDDRP